MTEDKLLNYADGQLLYNDLRERIDNKQTTPRGGKKGQVLKKRSNKNYDVGWSDESGGVQDIQVDETSVVENGVANIESKTVTYDGLLNLANDGMSFGDRDGPSVRHIFGAIGETDYASYSKAGVAKIDTYNGISMSRGYLAVNKADASKIKDGDNVYYFVPVSDQHASVFYGLAKAAGDTTQKKSSNEIGSYTDEAKAAIQNMIGIDYVPLVEAVEGTTVSIVGQPNVRYMCGEVTSISIQPPSVGSIDVMFTSGSSATALTLPPAVKMPEWFDSTSLKPNTVYEVLITDGVYGSVMTWAM